MLDVRAYEPRFIGDGRQELDLRSDDHLPDWASMEEHTDPAIIRRLYPDAAKLARENSAASELIEAHWDTPSRSTPCAITARR